MLAKASTRAISWFSESGEFVQNRCRPIAGDTTDARGRRGNLRYVYFWTVVVAFALEWTDVDNYSQWIRMLRRRAGTRMISGNRKKPYIRSDHVNI